jgi:septum formation topological specificity factor MinE
MDNLRLKRSFDILNRLFNRLLTILHSYFEIRSKALLNGLIEDPLAIEKLKKDIEDVENQYIEYDRSWKEDTQQLK